MKFKECLDEAKDNIKYRILTKDGKVKYAGTGKNSWFTLEKARKLVNSSKGEMIYEYDKNGERLWGNIITIGVLNEI